MSGVFQRWLTLVAYAVIGAVVAYVLRPLGLPVGELLASRVTPLGFPLIDVLYAAIVAGIIIALSPIQAVRWRHLFKIRYPSWIWSVVTGCVIAELLMHIAGESTLGLMSQTLIPELETILVGAAFGITIVSCWNTVSSTRLTKPPMSSLQGPPRANREWKLDPVQVEKWASFPEGPIDVLQTDLFGHAAIARRMARHISDVTSSRSIGLVGPYGSGKTSILHAVENLLRHKNTGFLVTWVHSWGASSGTAAAELILRAVLAELSRYVDCLALADVPSTYRAALDKSGWSALTAVLSLVPAVSQAESTLKRVDRVLAAYGKHLVIFLEDLDRNEFEDERFGEVQSLLNRLKQSTEHISFVLAIGEEARSHFDFAKLCDRYEVLGDLSESDIETIVKSFILARLLQYPKDVTWFVDENNRYLSSADNAKIPIPRRAIRLLQAPRALRTTLRIVLRAWPRLHGEVSILELIAVTSLRVGAPSAFQFLMTNIRSLRGNPFLTDSKKHIDLLKKRWEEANSGQPAYLATASHDVISYLFPTWATGGTMSPPTPQSIQTGPHAGLQLEILSDNVDYWQRMFAEEVNGLRDQQVARAVVRWKAKRHPSKLFRRLATSDVFGERFEQLVSASRNPAHPLFLDQKELYELAGNFHANFLSRGVEANLDKMPTGFLAVMRQQLLNGNLDDRHADWVLSEIDVSLDKSLRFALAIEYWWTDPRRHPNWQEKARRHLVEQARIRIEREPTKWLANILDPVYPWTLHHLVRHYYKNTVFQPSDWTWFVPHLSALIAADARFVPHVACMFSKESKRGELDDRGYPRLDPVWELDRDFMNTLIVDPHEQKELARGLCTSQDYPLIDDATRVQLRHLLMDIEKFLST